MTDRELMQQALEALEEINKLSVGENAICLPAEIDTAMDALRDRLAQPNEFNPDWDAMAVMVAEQQRIAKRIEELEAKPREWQWLTEEEIEVQIQRVMPYFGLHPMDYSRGGLPTIMFYGLVKETEVKLRKKNT